MIPLSEEQEARCLQQALGREEEEEKIQQKIHGLRQETRANRRQLKRLARKNCAAPRESSSDTGGSDEENDRHENEKPQAETGLSPEDNLKGRKMVRAATCVQVWNCLHDDGLEDDPEELDRGWMTALQALRKAINVAIFAPTSVLHRQVLGTVPFSL